MAPEETKYCLSVAQDNDNPSLCFENIKPKPKNLTIHQWLTAFNVFVAVYTANAPNSISSLMKYCEVVRDIAAKQGHWHYYGEQFRFLHQSKPECYPWNNVAWELWHRALHSALVVSRQHNKNDFEPIGPTNGPSSLFPKGCVGIFIPDSSVEVAVSDTHALNAGCTTLPFNAMPPEVTTQTNPHTSRYLGMTVWDERLLSRRPTSVRPDKLAFYLQG